MALDQKMTCDFLATFEHMPYDSNMLEEIKKIIRDRLPKNSVRRFVKELRDQGWEIPSEYPDEQVFEVVYGDATVDQETKVITFPVTLHALMLELSFTLKDKTGGDPAVCPRCGEGASQESHVCPHAKVLRNSHGDPDHDAFCTCCEGCVQKCVNTI